MAICVGRIGEKRNFLISGLSLNYFQPLTFVGFSMLDLWSIFYSVQPFTFVEFFMFDLYCETLSYSTVFFIKIVGYKTVNELLLSASQSAKSGRSNTETYFVSEDDSLHKK